MSQKAQASLESPLRPLFAPIDKNLHDYIADEGRRRRVSGALDVPKYKVVNRIVAEHRDLVELARRLESGASPQDVVTGLMDLAQRVLQPIEHLPTEFAAQRR